MANKHNDCRWLDRYMDCCRNTATHPNCWISPSGAVVFVEPKCLRCAGCGYEPTTPDAPAWDDPAESEERWADEYFVKWEAAEAEARRLRDLVRRMIPHVNDLKCHMWLYDFVKGIDCETDPKVLEMNALIDEAREALGEHEP